MRKWKIFKESLFFESTIEGCTDIIKTNKQFDWAASIPAFCDGWNILIENWKNYLKVLEFGGKKK